MNKIASFFDTLWTWCVWSSANENQVSTTLKYGLATLGSILTVALGFGHLQLDPTQWTAFSASFVMAVQNTIDASVIIVQNVVIVIGSVGTAIGLLRKIWLSLRGQNAQFSIPAAPATPPTAG